jgi:hypothetical protein
MCPCTSANEHTWKDGAIVLSAAFRQAASSKQIRFNGRKYVYGG